MFSFAGARGGRYKRGSGRRRGSSSEELVESQILRWERIVGAPLTCAEQPNCTFNAAPSRDGRRDRDRYNRRGNDGRRRDDDRRRDNDDRNNGGVPPVPGQPDIVPVPDVGVALNRIQLLTSAMKPLIDNLDDECVRWLNWIEWRNRNCRRNLTPLVQRWCSDAADNLRDLTDMQNEVVEMLGDCRRQQEIVERSGLRIPDAADMINSLDNRCMSQVVDGEVITLPGSQPRREGNNDRYNNRNGDNRENNDRQRDRDNNRDNDRRGDSRRSGRRY